MVPSSSFVFYKSFSSFIPSLIIIILSTTKTTTTNTTVNINVLPLTLTTFSTNYNVSSYFLLNHSTFITHTITTTTSSNDVHNENLDVSIEDGSLHQPLMLPRSLRAVATVICLIVLVLGLSGNILVLLVVCSQRDTLCNNSTNIFLINLSIADLLVLVVCTPTVLIELHSKPEVWMLGEFMCKTVPFVELVVAHGSILTILAISFERYYAICKPLKANYKCTNRRAVITICGLWSLALMATIPVLFGTELVEAIYIDGSLVSVCITKANATWQRVYFLVSIVGFFCLPLLILIVVYCIITRRLISDDRRLLIASIHSSFNSGSGMSSSSSKLRSGSLPFVQSSIIHSSDHQSTLSDNKEQSQSLWNHPAMFLFRGSITGSFSGAGGSHSGSGSGSAILPVSQNSQRRNSSMVQTASVARSRRQVIFMLAAVVICFFLCLLPFRLFTLWLLLVSEDDIRALSMERFYQLLYFCRVMIYVNSMLNPLLYAVVSSKFRQALMDTLVQIFGCCWWQDYYCLWCYCCEMETTIVDHDPLNDKQQKQQYHHRRHHRHCGHQVGTGMGILTLNHRRRKFLLMRQSTTLTTATTTTTASSSGGSLKNNSIRSTITTTNYFPSHNLDSSRFDDDIHPSSSQDSIRTGSKFVISQHLKQSGQFQHLQKSSFDSNEQQTNSNSQSNSEVIEPGVSSSSSPSPSRFNSIYSSQYTAEYRRKQMMKRSSRVAIIDENDGDCEDHGRFVVELNSRQKDFSIVKDEDQENRHDQGLEEESISSIIENLEDLLNDPKFSTYESYV